MFYEDELIFIEEEKSEIPWIKIFAKKEYKELSDCDEATKNRIFQVAMICEKAMIEFYNADKINHASFANYCPRVHWHVQARFKNDSFFPESMWGKKQRDAKLDLKSFDEFKIFLLKKLNSI